MTWLLGTEAGVIIWSTLLLALGVCIRYDDRTETAAAMTPDPDLYGPPDRGGEDDEQDDDWDVLFEWAPPWEDTDDRPD